MIAHYLKYREMGTPTTNNRPVMYRTVEEDYNNLYASELRTM